MVAVPGVLSGGTLVDGVVAREIAVKPLDAFFVSAWQSAIVHWYHCCGRKQLPWQNNPAPYRVWVSEVMLQQTQVSTVIPYYQRFLQRFPTVEGLAQATLDEVLAQWSGLGYYSRAHHLHAAARQLYAAQSEKNPVRLPEDLEALMALPGIGRSTAGAIRALGFGNPGVILDGNVKRVLSRVFLLDVPINSTAGERRLWSLAEHLTPAVEFAAYAQAMMDLGAGVCRQKNPHCAECPVENLCLARKEGVQEQYPLKKSGKRLPVRENAALVIENEWGEVLLCRQPDKGLWAGLYVFPEKSQIENTELLQGLQYATTIQHTFSHYVLHWQLWKKNILKEKIIETPDQVWYHRSENLTTIGLPAPVLRYLEKLSMSRMVMCRKYHQELPGLAFAPFPGAKGQEIFEQVSQRAWQEWLKHQTMLINENHLNMMDAKSQSFLGEQLQKFLDNEAYERPKGYVAPKS